eukprot:935577-Prymnesium_polylepis.1
MIPSDFEWFAHQIQRETKGSTPQPAQRWGLGAKCWPTVVHEATVGQRVLLARPTVVLLLLLTIRTVFSSQRLEALTGTAYAPHAPPVITCACPSPCSASAFVAVRA